MSVKSLTRVSALAIVAAMSASQALGQMSLPTINVGQHSKAKSAASKRPVHTASASSPSLPAPVASNLAGGNGGATTSTFVPPGGQIERGPTGVNGYFAAGTSSALKMNTKLIDRIPPARTAL